MREFNDGLISPTGISINLRKPRRRLPWVASRRRVDALEAEVEYLKFRLAAHLGHHHPGSQVDPFRERMSATDVSKIVSEPVDARS